MSQLDDRRVPVRGTIDKHTDIDVVVMHADDYALIETFVKDALSDNRRPDDQVAALKAIRLVEWGPETDGGSCGG